MQTGKAVLRDLVNATVGFERLAAQVKRPSKSLHRRLAPEGRGQKGFLTPFPAPFTLNHRAMTDFRLL